MKKSFLALAVAALAATSISTASAATVYDKDGTSLAVYGRVQAVVYSDKTGNADFTSTDGTVEQNATAVGSGRLGVDVRTQVYGDIAAFAKMEWDASDGNNHKQFDARYMWLGFDFAQAGQVKLGTFEPAIKYAIGQTDIFDDWGCTGLAGNDDKREAMVQYSWSGNGFDVLASVELPGTGVHVDGAHELGEIADVDYGVALALGYTSPDVVFGPIAVRAGYEKVEFADSLNNTNNTSIPPQAPNATTIYDSYDQYAVGLSWGSLNLGPYVGAVYHEREFDVNSLQAGKDGYKVSVTGYEFAVGYSFANGISARTGFLTQEYKVDAAKVEAKTVPVYVNWQLNPQVNVWAEASFDAGTDEDEVDATKDFAHYTGANYAENFFSAGVRYQF